ncbi:hypothetical protein F5Y14DRAFT_446438 [Nemania sp. NC0429]|nr:hypothetical protein F5Y14DRAFT_446438 [Nemania sp. NC0429]
MAVRANYPESPAMSVVTVALCCTAGISSRVFLSDQRQESLGSEYLLQVASERETDD